MRTAVSTSGIGLNAERGNHAITMLYGYYMNTVATLCYTQRIAK
jgi:hypothetical protein